MLKSYFVITDKGPYFNINQDSYAVGLENRVFAVIDGFGGSGIGDAVAQAVGAQVLQTFSAMDHDKDATLKYFYDWRRSIECNFLANGLFEFHSQLMKENAEKSLYQRGGATGAFTLLRHSKLTLLTVGKIFVFLYRNSQVSFLNLVEVGDQTAKPGELAKAGQWTKSGFGLADPLNLNIKEFQLLPSDRVLLATAGAVNGLTTDKLTELMAKGLSDKAVLQTCFENANQNGNYDNQTALILSF